MKLQPNALWQDPSGLSRKMQSVQVLTFSGFLGSALPLETLMKYGEVQAASQTGALYSEHYLGLESVQHEI